MKAALSGLRSLNYLKKTGVKFQIVNTYIKTIYPEQLSLIFPWMAEVSNENVGYGRLGFENSVFR